MTGQEKKTPFRVVCKSCGHQWVAAYTPLPLLKMADLLRSLHCPMCAADAQFIRQFDEDSPAPAASAKRGTR